MKIRSPGQCVYVLVTGPRGRFTSYTFELLFLIFVGVGLGATLLFVPDLAGLTVPTPLFPAMAYGLVLTVVGVLFYRARHRRFDEPVGRMRRLDGLLARPGALERFPHRAVERVRRRYPNSLWRLRRVLRRLSPGTTIIAHGSDGGDIVLFLGSACPFEPIELNEGPARLVDLLQARFDELAAKAARQDRHAYVDGVKRFSESVRRSVGPVIGGTFFPLWLTRALLPVLGFGAAAFFLWRDEQWALLGAWVVYGIVGYLGLRFWNDEYWLVPGGIVVRSHRPHRRAPHGWYLGRGRCVLYADGKTESIWIAHERAVVRMPERTLLAGFLVGWLSAAEPPSCEEVCDFAGIAPERLG